MSLLSVRNLSVSFASDRGPLQVLDNINFDLEKGETLGLVGESGCGKSVTALSIIDLLPKPSGQIINGEIVLNGRDIVAIPVKERYQIRGKRIAMIFQEPMTALNPVHRIGRQLAEVYRLHFPAMRSNDIIQASAEMLGKVGIADPLQRLMEYPHQLSGGMRQRVMIAMALACEPDILIADEPTTALDVTIQAQILGLLRDLQRANGMSILFITHDLGVVAEMCDRVAVMYAGRLVEQAPVIPLFETPCHPYTKGLLASLPQLSYQPKTPLPTIAGSVPPISEFGHACRFSNRCHHVTPECERERPHQQIIGYGRTVACLRWKELQQ
ncbi:MAG: ABC transporter ATP-binding protein [Pseudomonadales bacterium]